MNDVEHDLREVLDQKAGSVGTVAPRLPDGVRARSRRRQLGTALVSGLAVAALVVGSVGALRAIDTGADRQPTPADDPWTGYEVFDRTAVIENFTITSPSDWYLVNQWPLGASLATTSTGSNSGSCEVSIGPGEESSGDMVCVDGTSSPAPVNTTPLVPMLQLSSNDLGLGTSPCAIGGLQPNGDDAVLEVTIDAAAIDAREAGVAGTSPAWPVRFDESATELGTCGQGHYARFEVGVYSYVAFAAFGSDATEEDRRTLFDAFATMQVSEWTGTAPSSRTPAYVIAGGENAAGPWRLELRPQSEPGYLTNVQLQLTTTEGAGIAAGGPFTVNEDLPIEQAGGDPVFGAVVKEADGVDLHLEEGTPTIPAQLVPLPPSMPFDFDLFFASNDTDVAPTAVPLGLRDQDPSTTTDGRQIVAEGISGDTPWALEFSRIPRKNTLALRDLRDGSILARLEPDSLNRVHTSGLEFVPEAIPGGSVLIFGVAAPAATHLAIALDHGSVTYLQAGDPRWDPLPILTGTGEPGLRLWWAELPIDVGEVVTFSETCDVLARKVFIPDHVVRQPFADEEMDPRIACSPES